MLLYANSLHVWFYLLLPLLLGFALVVGVGGTIVAGLNELSALEAVVSSSFLFFLSTAGLSLLLILFSTRFSLLSKRSEA